MNTLVILTTLATIAFAAPPLSSPRVVGGKDAPEGVFPFQVSLRFRDKHSCGGVIIHPEWVLTSATCVLGRDHPSLSVVVGSTQLSSGGTKYQVTGAFPHRDFDEFTDQNNIALLAVRRMSFSSRVNSILLDTSSVAGGQDCTLSGWGSSTGSYPPTWSEKLQYINLKTLDVKTCDDSVPWYPITEKNICTLTQFGEGGCSGDSGGPLIKTIQGQTKLIGVLTGTLSPCATSKPDLYARVASFHAWIKSTCNCI